jgi:hypothetical protein
MKKYLLFATAGLGLLASSCYYDPSFGGGGSYGASTTYGVSSFGSGYSSSVFVSTGDPRWAYDPYRYCYYDRYSYRYYDPYRFGYYPVGYCPVAVRGCPHPYNWSGRGYCPPPRSIRSHTLSDCDNRINYYRSANHHWSRNVSTSGSSSWMNSSERSNLHKQSSYNDHRGSNSGNSNWRGDDNRQRPDSRYQNSPPSRGSYNSTLRPQSSSSWNGNSSRPQPQAYVRETPSIQPRPTSGGMFNGMDRNSRQPDVQRNESQRQNFTPPAQQPSRRDNDRSSQNNDRDSDKKNPFRRSGE